MCPLPTEDELSQAESFISRIGIPSPPQLVLKLSAEMLKPEPEYQTVAKMVARDTALSAKVIKTINSPFFGMKRKVRSIDHAITLLGLGLFKRLVLFSALKEILSFGQDPSRYEDLWEHNLMVAKVAQHLASYLKSTCSPETAYMTGLFHDCGVPLMMKKFSDYNPWETYFSQMAEVDILESEFSRFQTNHCAIGCLVAKSWNLPEEIILAIRLHHRAPFPADLVDLQLAMEIWAILRSAQIIGSYLRWHQGKLTMAEFAFEGHSIETYFDDHLLDALRLDRTRLWQFIQAMLVSEQQLLAE